MVWFFSVERFLKVLAKISRSLQQAVHGLCIKHSNRKYNLCEYIFGECQNHLHQIELCYKLFLTWKGRSKSLSPNTNVMTSCLHYLDFIYIYIYTHGSRTRASKEHL
jgi:hypothetical protein